MTENINDLDKRFDKVKNIISAVRSEVDNSISALSSVMDDNNKSNDQKISQIQKLVIDLEDRIDKRIDAIDSRIKINFQEIATQQTHLREFQTNQQNCKLETEKLTNDLGRLADRINGVTTPGLNRRNIEQIDAELERANAQLNGQGGRMTLNDLISKAESEKAVNSTLNKIISTVGFGTVLTGIIAAFGLTRSPDLSPIVSTQTGKISTLESANSELKSKVDKLETEILQFYKNQKK